MKAVLEFNLPEDGEEFRLAQEGWKYQGALLDVLEYIRGRLKYAATPLSAAVIEELEEVKKIILENVPNLLE